MYEKSVTYTDYEGNERTEKHLFHLNKAEVIKWLTTSGDYTLDKVLIRLQKDHNMKRAMDIFDDLIHKSYGCVSLDGKKFEKNEQLWEDFHQSEAYSTIFMELISDAKAAAEFVNGILPKDMTDEIAKIIKDNPEGIPDELKDYMPALDVIPKA